MLLFYILKLSAYFASLCCLVIMLLAKTPVHCPGGVPGEGDGEQGQQTYHAEMFPRLQKI